MFGIGTGNQDGLRLSLENCLSGDSSDPLSTNELPGLPSALETQGSPGTRASKGKPGDYVRSGRNRRRATFAKPTGGDGTEEIKAFARTIKRNRAPS